MGELPPVIIDVNRASYPFFGAWLTAGILALIFLPPLLLKVFSARLGGSGPLWVYGLLGLGLPVLAFGVGYFLAVRSSASWDFDTIKIERESIVFQHSLTHKSVSVPRETLVRWDREEYDPPATEYYPVTYVFVAVLADGRRLKGEPADSVLYDLTKRRIVEAFEKNGLPIPAQ
jgi:hypothetical protein